MAEIHLVAVEGEDLFLRVALLDLDGEQRFLDLAFPGLLVGQKQLACQLLRQRAGAARLAHLDQVVDEREQDALRVEADVPEEVRVFGREDRLAQDERDFLVADHHAPLDGKVADQLSVLAEDARDGVGRVLVEGTDLGKVVRIRKQDATQRAEQGRADEEGRNPGVSSETEHDGHRRTPGNR